MAQVFHTRFEAPLLPADYGFRASGAGSSVAAVVGRFVAWWVSVAVACGGLGCSGRSAWILQEAAAGAPGTAVDAGGVEGGVEASTPDPLEVDADGGVEIADAAAADAGSPVRNPEDFAAVCAPQIAFDNRTANGRGALFDQAFPAPGDAVREIARQVCAILYKTPEEVPLSPPIVLIIEDFYGIGDVSITGPVIYMRLSSLRMQSVAEAGQSVRDDVTGSLLYMLAIDYELDDENPGTVRWVTEGIAAFVRYRAGHTSLAERRPGGGPRDDYKATGFFFDWLDRTYPDAVYRLNQSLDPDDQREWSERVFVEITGKDLPALWSDYQRSL
jgi:hypothetical protein